MYRKIRCDVRQWKILETFRGTKHSPQDVYPQSAEKSAERRESFAGHGRDTEKLLVTVGNTLIYGYTRLGYCQV